MSPVAKSTSSQKQSFCFWLSASLHHSFHFLHACSRSPSNASTLLSLQW